jgi:isopenicillin N synthase-like dioxygenase
MSRTGSNRGWGAPHSERVNPNANPDYKQVFDCGYELPPNDSLANLSVYAPNQWPDTPTDFAPIITDYYSRACLVAMDLLRGIAAAIGQRQDYFDNAFSRPMALLRGNYYPPRPPWAGDHDFGIAAHTDYGCLTLLATDSVAGLDAQTPNGTWVPVQAHLGDFIVNFGEMLEMWSGGRVRATPHRVRGSNAERISVPLFFNPNHDTNVAPNGEPIIRAADHLTKRFSETYVHLQKDN